MRPLFAFVLMLFLGGSMAARAQQLAWNPAQTRVFIVGLLKWENSEEFESFPALNRRDLDLVDFYRRAGVPKANLVYLQDKQATLATIRQSLNQMLAVSQPGETLIVYYEGHGFSDEEEGSPVFFASYDAGVGKVKGWSVRELVSRIDKDFKGNQVILMADCCQSGALAEAAGRKDRRLSYACFGSTQSDETSTGNWTFTEALLSAWRGEGPVDADRNGGVSIKEMQNYLNSEMAFAEEQKPTSLLTGTWKGSDVLAKARPLVNPREGEHVEVYSEEDWWMARIVDGKDGRYKVFYYGYENDDSEWVNQKRLRRPKEVIEEISAKLGLNLN